MHSEIDQVPGRIDIDVIEDPEWNYYWNAWVGGVHVNGGLGMDIPDCMSSAKHAIFHYRHWGLGEKTGWDRNLDFYHS